MHQYYDYNRLSFQGVFQERMNIQKDVTIGASLNVLFLGGL